jgi:hypothetical protein
VVPEQTKQFGTQAVQALFVVSRKKLCLQSEQPAKVLSVQVLQLGTQFPQTVLAFAEQAAI